MATSILVFFSDPVVQTVMRFCVTVFGATCMYVFSLNKGFEGSAPFLKRMFPGKKKTFYDRTDFFIVNLAGAVIGTVFYAPSNFLQALAAGFGWVGAINILMKTNERSGDVVTDKEQEP